jgi:DNA-3-methyladenine glycosylase II
MTSYVLTPVAPFDFAHTLAFVRGFSPMGGEQTVEGDRLTKALAIGGRAVGFRVTAGGNRERPAVAVELPGRGRLPEPFERETLARIGAYLGTDDDLEAFYAAAADDAAFAPLTTRYRGLHHVRFPSAFEAACWGVINQRIAQPLARRWKEALTRRAGVRVTIDGNEYWAFPEPAAVVRLDLEELARLVPGGRRAAAIAALARAFLQVDSSFLTNAPIDSVRSWLRSIHGVGPFTSSFVLYRGLGRFDGASLVSPRLVAAASAQYRARLDAKDVARMAAAYGPWGGYWMLYLWASTFVPTPRLRDREIGIERTCDRDPSTLRKARSRVAARARRPLPQ